VKRAYLALVAITLALALASRLPARMPRGAAATRAAAPAARTLALALAIEHGAVTPEAASVPRDAIVRLSVWNRGARPLRFALAGYDDRVNAAIAAGETLRVEFVADRPGGDFAWLVDAQPAGRFAVSGSHLVDGHR
jgi:hypothetical protein